VTNRVKDIERIRRTLRKASFATLATTSAAQRPLVAGVLFAAVDDALWIATTGTSAKVRNIRENPRVAVCVPLKRLPLFPPFVVQLQSTATLHAPDDPVVTDLVASGRLKKVTSHGELEIPDAVLVRIPLPRRVATFGLGVPIRMLIRDPLAAARTVELA
jgi:hypothetical protein